MHPDQLNIHQYQDLSMRHVPYVIAQIDTNQYSTRYQEHSNKINIAYITNVGFALFLNFVLIPS